MKKIDNSGPSVVCKIRSRLQKSRLISLNHFSQGTKRRKRGLSRANRTSGLVRKNRLLVLPYNESHPGLMGGGGGGGGTR